MSIDISAASLIDNWDAIETSRVVYFSFGNSEDGYLIRETKSIRAFRAGQKTCEKAERRRHQRITWSKGKKSRELKRSDGLEQANGERHTGERIVCDSNKGTTSFFHPSLYHPKLGGLGSFTVEGKNGIC